MGEGWRHLIYSESRHWPLCSSGLSSQGHVKPVALFVCRTSPYWGLLGDDRCYDIERDARTYAGPDPAICHPPCRAWGRYKSVAKARADESELAFFSLDIVRRFGGVIEHPASSSFWKAAGIVPGGLPDPWGGWAMNIRQGDFGHRAEKLTTLYFVGVPRWPDLPPPVQVPWHSIERMGRPERERTPTRLATWLVRLFCPPSSACHEEG